MYEMLQLMTLSQIKLRDDYSEDVDDDEGDLDDQEGIEGEESMEEMERSTMEDGRG